MIRFSLLRRPVSLPLVAAIVLMGTTAPAAAQDEQAARFAPTGDGLPNPTSEVIRGWGPLPDGREWGSTAGVDIDPTDGHVWAYDRCGGIMLAGGCAENLVDPVVKFDRNTGEVLASFGAGLFVLPHGIHVDSDGNVWITDSQGTEDKGHRVIKFSPEGEVLLILGQAGRAGSAPGLLNEPCDVITAPNGDIFVSDGHSGQNGRVPEGATGRILKFDRDGNFIKEWGTIGSEPGQFRTPHALAFDSRGRLFVADRGNHRIQIFDQDGNYLDSYYQFGRISGLFIDADDTLYAIDSESTPRNHEGWSTGVRIGHAGEDRVTAFIPPHPSERNPQGAAGEGVAVDADGNVYAAEGPNSRADAGGGLTKSGGGSPRDHGRSNYEGMCSPGDFLPCGYGLRRGTVLHGRAPVNPSRAQVRARPGVAIRCRLQEMRFPVEKRPHPRRPHSCPSPHPDSPSMRRHRTGVKMRKTILSAACALALVAFSPLASAEPPAAGEALGAIHINGLGCGMMDADGGVVWVTSDRAVITPNGQERITCKATRIPNSSRRAVQFNYENTGMTCWTDVGPTTEWHQTISASGNSTLTCFFR